MSTFKVEIVKLGPIERHPNADSLGITQVFGYPVITKLKESGGSFSEGDLVAYIPVDSVVPETPEWAFLWAPAATPRAKGRRIKAKKLRGIFSMGMLAPAPEGATEGEDVAERLGITKYEEPEENVNLGQVNARPEPSWAVKYTDIENYRRYPNILEIGEEVVITEKIHGANCRICVYNDEVWVGSHRLWRAKSDTPDVWWQIAEKHQASLDILGQFGNPCIVFGEIYGQVQDLRYGSGSGEIWFRAFDLFSIGERKYFNYPEFKSVVGDVLGLPLVPVLYRGSWDPAIAEELVSGNSTIAGAEHIREGIVIKPTVERWDQRVGRVALKHINPDYLLRKGGTERH